MSRFSWSGLALAAGMLIASTHGAVSATPPAGTLTNIRIGISPFQDTLLPIIGEEKGWFKQAGLNVSFQTLAWNAVMPALASNSVDVAVYNTTGIISVYSKMPNAVFLYPWNIFSEGQALMGRPGLGLKTVKDFEKEGKSHADAVKATIQQIKGKTVITTMGSDMGKSVMDVTANNGIAKSDFDIVDMDPDQGMAAFLSGSGDMYVGGIPQRSRLEHEGYTTMLVGPDLAPVPINGWVTTQEFAAKNEDALLRLQHVMFRIIRYTDAHTQDAGKIITDKLNSETGSNMSVAEFEKYFRQIEEFTGNAAVVQKDLLNENGFAWWKKTWDNDNKYFFKVDKLIPEAVPYDAFAGDKFQQKYIAKFGANETGY